ncbi:ABC transporter permease [Pseudothauera rhizosphaerae]|uniref:Transport permease protein n=1 Tax=Pseudothauera rhizosphaerae TaxID=2565932 RepID=A0A4S4AB61_9RHOO|nr:ABC transporter permease [Pseudothauera rhizosphaerae]THF56179.1 ABC transporter permease [Pseudothauera rhizosphaerae]
MISNFTTHRYLLGQLILRDVLLRYRGAMFGILWIFLSPLLMLAIFAFVFGHIFQSRWPEQPEGLPFWLLLYSGLIVFNIFGEAVSRSPTAVRAYPSYVKKIIFPVYLLPLVPLGTCLIHAGLNLLILVAALAWTGHLSSGILLAPLLILPVLLFATGLSWFLSAWGVFIKDMTQIVPLFVQMTFFLSPVLYPVSVVPPALRPLYEYNPLGAVIEAIRAAVFGMHISWVPWIVSLISGSIAAVLGLAFFMHSRDEFADAL